MIDHVRLRTGETWRPAARRQQALPRATTDLVTQVLQGVITRGTGTAAGIGRPAAGKTGTTEDYRDAWFVGYTPELATAVWVGHAEGGIPMRTENEGAPVTGGSIPAAIWAEFMRAALAGVPPGEFEVEEPRYVTVSIDLESGLLAGPWCVGAVPARFIEGSEPTEHAQSCTERERPLPDVTGLTAADARARLSEAGYEDVQLEERLVSDADQDGAVVAQQPPAGTPAFRDESITLWVGDDPFSD